MWGSPDLAGTGDNLFHPIVQVPEDYWVLDLQKPQSDWNQYYDFTIDNGINSQEYWSFNMSNQQLFSISLADNDEDGSYGPTIITEHRIPIEGVEQMLWVLHGHLSRNSLEGLEVGARISKGEQIGSMGAEHENGGWPPHVHIQLTFVEPTEPDLEGVVAPHNRDEALQRYPDPRNLLGRLY